MVKNALDVWYLVYITLRCLHMRNGQLDVEAPVLPNYLAAIPEIEMIELCKEALETVSVLLSHFFGVRL